MFKKLVSWIQFTYQQQKKTWKKNVMQIFFRSFTRRDKRKNSTRKISVSHVVPENKLLESNLQ